MWQFEVCGLMTKIDFCHLWELSYVMWINRFCGEACLFCFWTKNKCIACLGGVLGQRDLLFEKILNLRSDILLFSESFQKTLDWACCPLQIYTRNRNKTLADAFSFEINRLSEGMNTCLVCVHVRIFESLLVKTIEVKAVQVCNSHEVMCCFYEWLPSLLCQRCDCHKLTDGTLPPSLSLRLLYSLRCFSVFVRCFLLEFLFSATFTLIIYA